MRVMFVVIVVLAGALLGAAIRALEVLDGYRNEIRIAESAPRGEALARQLMQSPLPYDAAEFEQGLASDLSHLNAPTQELRDFLQHVMLSQALGEPVPVVASAAGAVEWLRANAEPVAQLRARAMRQVLQLGAMPATAAGKTAWEVDVLNTSRFDVTGFDLRLRPGAADQALPGGWHEIRCREATHLPERPAIPAGGRAQGRCEIAGERGGVPTSGDVAAVLEALRAGRLQLAATVRELTLREGSAANGVMLRRLPYAEGRPESMMIAYAALRPRRAPLPQRVGCEVLGECDLERKKGWVAYHGDVWGAIVVLAGMLVGLVLTGLSKLAPAGGPRNVLSTGLALLPVAAVATGLAIFTQGYEGFGVLFVGALLALGYWPGMLLAHWTLRRR